MKDNDNVASLTQSCDTTTTTIAGTGVTQPSKIMAATRHSRPEVCVLTFTFWPSTLRTDITVVTCFLLRTQSLGRDRPMRLNTANFA